MALSTFSHNVRLCITTNACILVSGLDIRTARTHEASIKDAQDCWQHSRALCDKFPAHTSEVHARTHLKRTHTHTHTHTHLKRTHTHTSEAHAHTHIWSARTHTHLKRTHTRGWHFFGNPAGWEAKSLRITWLGRERKIFNREWAGPGIVIIPNFTHKYTFYINKLYILILNSILVALSLYALLLFALVCWLSEWRSPWWTDC